MAFLTTSPLPSARPTPVSRKPICTCNTPKPAPQTSRRHLLAAAGAGLAGLLAGASTLPSAANAGVGSALERAFSKVLFPKEGFNAPDTLSPSPAIINKDALATTEAKNALATLRTYQGAIVDLYDRFKNDDQMELAVPVRKLVSISELRNALNIVNEAVDEESQVQTDKVVRGIIQDIGELQTAAVVKKGQVRTPKKIDRTNDWFLKLTADFQRLLSFYS